MHGVAALEGWVHGCTHCHKRTRTQAGGKRGWPEGLSHGQEPKRPIWRMRFGFFGSCTGDNSASGHSVNTP